MSKTIVVVGGALAGPAAAARAREIDDGARIVLLERNTRVSYAVGGLAAHLAGEVRTLAALDRERAAFFRDVHRVEVRTRARVTHVDAGARLLSLDGERLRFDALVVATGASSAVPALAGLEGARNVVAFRTLDDLTTLERHVEGGRRRAVVLGGGFFGVEAADALARRGVATTLVERGARLLPQYSAGVARLAERELGDMGVTVSLGAHIERVERKGARASALVLAGGERVPLDALVLAVGLAPRTELLGELGARLLPDGTAQVDERCQTSVPGVFACGVCVSLPHAVTGRPVWLAQAAIADKTAQVAGANAAGGDARMPAVVGTAIVRTGGLTLARTGAALDGSGPRSGVVRAQGPSHDRFLGDAGDVLVELTYDERSGRLLAAEAAGATGVDKRIDVLATAIAGGMTVEQLALLDLAYAAPFSTARDPVNVAAQVAAAARAGLAAPISGAELDAMKPRARVVHVAARRKGRARTVPGAVAMTLVDVRERSAELARERALVFVCETGKLSYLAVRIARAAGAVDARYLSGGLTFWRAEGRALARASAS